MKYNNDHYFKFGINGLIVTCGAILFYYVLFNTDKLSSVFGSIFTVLMPFIIGIAIAYILNPIMVFLETRIIYKLLVRVVNDFNNKTRLKRIIRYFTAILVIILFLAGLYGLFILIVPQLILNIQAIIFRAPIYLDNLNNYYNDFMVSNPRFKEFFSDSMLDINSWIKSIVMPSITDWLSHTSTLFSSIVYLFKSVINLILGIIIAIYMLIDKEKFLSQCKKVIYAIFKEKKANNYLNNLRYSNNIFSGFVTGKVVDSILIGIMTYLGCILLKMPYPLLVSVIIGVTNVIPYFGPFLGTIPSALLVFVISPQKCIIFLIFIFVLQQFDGNVLGPKILGDSVGLNSFWVIFSITVFSKFFGALGMFIGVPLFAVIYTAFGTFINQKLIAKNMPIESNFYMVSDYYTDSNKENKGKTFKFTRNFKEKSGLDRFTSIFIGNDPMEHEEKGNKTEENGNDNINK